MKEFRKRIIPSEIPSFEEVQPSSGVSPVRPIKGSVRSGLVGYKCGQMGIWDEWGHRHLVTVVKIHDCFVTRKRTTARNGYEAIQLSCGRKPLMHTNRIEAGQYFRLGIFPKSHQAEFRVSSENLLPVGMKMSVRHFVPGQWLFVTGMTRARGFRGAKKRWHMQGQSKTHGTIKGENTMGSVGQGKGIGKVWKYKRMDGHQGPDPRAVNSKLIRYESTRNILFLKGCLPGGVGSLLKIFDARGKTSMKNVHIKLPFPTFLVDRPEKLPVTVQQHPLDRDPFLFPDRVFKEKRVKS